MSELVEDGLTNLFSELVIRQSKFEVRFVEDDNPVGEGAGIVPSFGKGHTFVDAQEVSLVFGRSIFDYDDQVVDLVHDPIRE